MEEFEAEVTLGRADAALSFGRPVFDESHYVVIPFRVRAAGIDGRPAIGLDARTSIELDGLCRPRSCQMSARETLGALPC